jgi:alkylation response protein AidB-like acyl-CoA dehydrogenase
MLGPEFGGRVKTPHSGDCDPECVLDVTGDEYRVALESLSRRLPAESGEAPAPYSISVHELLRVWYPAGSADLADLADPLADPAEPVNLADSANPAESMDLGVSEPWWKPVAVAERLAGLLPPTRAAAFAVHREIGIPAVQGMKPLGGDEPTVIAYPSAGAGAAVRAQTVQAGVVLNGATPGYFLGGPGDHLLLVPIERPGAAECVCALIRPDGASARLIVDTAHPAGAAILETDHCFVPEEQLTVVRPEWEAAARAWIAAYRLFAAKSVLRATHRHLAARSSQGGVLWDHQALRFRLSALTASGDGTEQLVYRAAHRIAAGLPADQTIAAAEFKAAELLRDVTSECLHLHGAAGQVREKGIQTLFMETRLLGLCSFTAAPGGNPDTDEMAARSEPGVDAYRRKLAAFVAQRADLFGEPCQSVPGGRQLERAVIEELGRAGLLAAPIYGTAASGPDQPDQRATDLEYSAVLHETLAPFPVGAAVLTHVEVGARLLAAFPPAQSAVSAAAEGRHLAALAVTEPSGGLDFDAMATTLRQDADGLELNGEKWCSSNAPFADELLVLARDTAFPDGAPGRHTLVRVPVDAAGVRVAPLDTFGHRGLTGQIEFTSVRLPAEAVLGTRGSGVLRLMGHWVHERVMLALRAVSMAHRLLSLLEESEQGQRDPDLLRSLRYAVLQERIACRHALARLADHSCDLRAAGGCKLRSVALLRRTAEAAFPGGGAAADRALREATGLALAGGSDEALLLQIARTL